MRPIKFRIWDREAKKIRQVNSLHLETDQEGEWCVECYGKSYVTNEGDHDATIDFIRGHNFELMQFTGLHDKNSLKELYEGDIIDADGNLKGNIYESPQVYEEGIDCLIEGMGTEKWRSTESIAMGRGCKYSK